MLQFLFVPCGPCHQHHFLRAESKGAGWLTPGKRIKHTEQPKADGAADTREFVCMCFTQPQDTGQNKLLVTMRHLVEVASAHGPQGQGHGDSLGHSCHGVTPKPGTHRSQLPSQVSPNAAASWALGGQPYTSSVGQHQDPRAGPRTADTKPLRLLPISKTT